MTELAPLSVAILAGGRSRRMGRDKALLSLGDQTLLEVVASRVASLAADVFVVATERPEYGALGFRVVPDSYPDTGSLGGIHSAVRHARNEHCLVVACDMPLLNPELLRFMAALPRDYDVLVPALPAERSDQGGAETLETLHAIYSRRCIAPIQRRLEAGRFKIVEFFADVVVQRLSEDVIRRYDPQLRSFFNANTPEDFAWAASELGRGGLVEDDSARPGSQASGDRRE